MDNFNDYLIQLKNGADEVKKAFENKMYRRGEIGMESYWEIGKQYASIALAIFDHQKANGNIPRLSPYFAINRYHASGKMPTDVEFWEDPDAITELYFDLEKGGYY